MTETRAIAPPGIAIPSGKDVALTMKSQINEYTARIADTLRGMPPGQIPEKIRKTAEALGYWDDDGGITDSKKFAGRLNGILQESVRLFGKENCFGELCDGARGGRVMEKPMDLTLKGAGKFDVGNDVLRDILAGFGKHLDRGAEEGRGIAVTFKNVGFSNDGKFVEINLQWRGPVNPSEIKIEAKNEFTGKKKAG